MVSAKVFMTFSNRVHMLAKESKEGAAEDEWMASCENVEEGVLEGGSVIIREDFKLEYGNERGGRVERNVLG